MNDPYHASLEKYWLSLRAPLSNYFFSPDVQNLFVASNPTLYAELNSIPTIFFK